MLILSQAQLSKEISNILAKSAVKVYARIKTLFSVHNVKYAHTQCIGLSKGTFKHYLDNPDVDWTCGWYSLSFPFHDVDYYSEEEVDKEVSDLFNASIEKESLYSSWKIAKLTPIFKKDDATEIGNYRPTDIVTQYSE